MNKDFIKISFVGDIMCEGPQLKAAKRRNKYEFDKMFVNIKDYFNDSDYVVGNLETPISDNFGYTNDLYCFNTPKEFLLSLKKVGFDLLLTANNHCLDRGIDGINKTINEIKKAGMDSTGTYNTLEDSNEFLIKTIDGVRICFLNYTYGTNYSYNKYFLKQDDLYKVNLLKKQNSNPTWKKFSKFDYIKVMLGFRKKIKRILKKIIYCMLNKRYSFKNSVVIDEINKEEWFIDDKYLDSIRQKIEKAKSMSDIVIFCMHSGGQFNDKPGTFTESFVKNILDTNVDFIVGTHPHIVQYMEKANEKLVAYSLGNFTISPSSIYLNHDFLPEYSIILNCYIDKYSKNIIKYTFSIIKVLDIIKNYSSVFLLYDLIQNQTDFEKKDILLKDNLFIYNRVMDTNLKNLELKKEYEIDLDKVKRYK